MGRLQKVRNTGPSRCMLGTFRTKYYLDTEHHHEGMRMALACGEEYSVSVFFLSPWSIGSLDRVSLT